MVLPKILLVDTPGDIRVPNIGLAILATYLERNGNIVRLINPHLSNDWGDYVLKALSQWKPEILGFSIHCTTVTKVLSWLSKNSHHFYSNLAVVFGGPQVQGELENFEYAQSFSVNYKIAPKV